MANQSFPQPPGQFGSSGPYGNPGYQAPPPKSDSGVKLLLIILGSIGVIGLLLCAGLGFGAYYLLQRGEALIREAALSNAESNLDYMEEEFDPELMKELVGQAPEVKEAVGEVTEISFDREKTAKNLNVVSLDEWYRVKGAKGEVTVKARPGFEERWYDAASIVKEDGTEVTLTLPTLPHFDYETRDAYRILSTESKITELVGKITSVDYPTSEEEDPANLNDMQVMYKLKGERDSGLVIFTYAASYDQPISAKLKLDKAGEVQVSFQRNKSP